MYRIAGMISFSFEGGYRPRRRHASDRCCDAADIVTPGHMRVTRRV